MEKKVKIIVERCELDRYLLKINSIFPTEKIIKNDIADEDVIKYFQDSYIGYKYFHSTEDAVHMAINYNGKFNKDGYYTQPREILQQIDEMKANRVLEIGCGKGFNSVYLANRKPEVEFLGIDVTDKHLTIANKKSLHLENLVFNYGDFHKLEFKDSSFDIIFALESLCYANDKKKALSEIYRVLKKGGKFILYDGFKKVPLEGISDNRLIDAIILTEKSMGVNHFDSVENWNNIANSVGFKIKINNDLSEAIMPNLGKLQYLSRGYFKFAFLSKLFLRILPKKMLMNSIAGLLMPFTFHCKVHGYYKIVLEK